MGELVEPDEVAAGDLVVAGGQLLLRPVGIDLPVQFHRSGGRRPFRATCGASRHSGSRMPRWPSPLHSMVTQLPPCSGCSSVIRIR